MSENKLGVIEISEMYLKDIPLLKAIFKDVIVMDMQKEFSKRTRRYLVYSDKFEEVGQQEFIPMYDVIIHTLESNNEVVDYHVTFKKSIFQY